MSIIREFGHFTGNFSDLPAWAKLVVVLCLGAVVTVVVMSIYTETSIDQSASSVPVPSTGQTYRVYVMHSPGYVTREHMEKLAFWRNKIQLAVISVLVAYVVLFVYRAKD